MLFFCSPKSHKNSNSKLLAISEKLYINKTLTEARAVSGIEVSERTTFRIGYSDLKTSSLSSDAPSWISMRMLHKAAVDFSSPIPFFKLLSRQSVIVILLEHSVK